jgi:hypothetical protein
MSVSLEKTIEIKTFITPQNYDDKVTLRGFTKEDNLQDYIRILKELNRAFLRKYGVQEVTIVMSHHKEEVNNNGSIIQNSR